VIEPTNESLHQFRRNRVASATENPAQFAWSPAYATAAGDLPLGELPRFVVWNGSEPQTVVRCNLDVSAGGAVKLRINSPAGLTFFVGNATVDVKLETVIDLKPGPQVLTFVIDRSKRSEDLRVELDDVPGSPARVSVVGGK
jgi:hypothetical protein